MVQSQNSQIRNPEILKSSDPEISRIPPRVIDLRDATQGRRQITVRALRCERGLGAARRREVLSRLLGQEDRRRRNRRARVCAEALYPRAQRREISRLSLHAQAPLRSADRGGRWLRSVPDDDALPEFRVG